jgi:hypothetical protein
MVIRLFRAERGVALIAVILLLMLTAAVATAFTAVVMSEQRLQMIERGRSEAFYAAHGALEKLTADLGTLFGTTYAPTAAMVNALGNSPPALAGVSFPTTTEGAGYGITFTGDANGNPASSSRSITSGPFQGFTGLVTPYTLAVTALTGTGGEVRLQRQVQTVGIPILQFGNFSETGLGFHAGGDFDFGGRVHTNGNLFLAAGGTLLLADKVSAVGEVIRTNMMNGSAIGGSYPGAVRPITTPGNYRSLTTTEGSLVNNIGSAQNEPTWSNLSIGTYNGNIVNGRTGARRLDLPIVTEGATPIDLIRRPPAGEGTSSSVFQQRYFGLASMRILLSDSVNEISSLQTVSGTTPIELGNTLPAGYTTSGNKPPFAKSHATTQGNYRVPLGTTVLGGYLKIEIQTATNSWSDVTMEILNLGFAGRKLNGSCNEPNPDAVIRIQRISDSLSGCAGGTQVASDYWPLTLYDTREALKRDTESTSNTNVYLGGVMHYIELDVRNLSRWFRGEIGSSGPSAMAVTGYTVYFSDRRNNKNAAGLETGEFGFEDFVNPASSSGTPNGVLDTGEDVNGNGTLETYGQIPSGIVQTSPLDNSARPWTSVSSAIAQVNPPRLFRRALKLTNGTLGNIISPGLSVVSENPVYIQGHYNATASGFGDPHVSCAVMADAITFLSASWSDRTSFLYPHNAASRPATTTYYRVALLGGKGMAFPWPSAGSPPINFGTDGGVHNFLRLLESWSGRTLYYRGSIASLYYSRQGMGVFKDGSNTYDFPTDRDYRFDVDFLNMNLLPPRTPMFRDVNVLGFTQVLTAPR